MAAITQFIDQAKQNRDRFNQQGDEINQYLRDRQGYYDQNERAYQDQADLAYQDLNQTPGYNSVEAGGIYGDPNAAFRYYNPDMLSGDMQQGNADVFNSATSYGRGIRQASDRTATNLGGAATAGSEGLRGAASRLGAGVTSAADAYGSGVTSAADQAAATLRAPTDDQTGWQNGVYGYLRGENEGALDEYGNALSSATDRDKLALSRDFAKDYGMSDAEMQGIKDVAAQSTAGQYAKMAANAKLRAAAQGNTSPAALAAIEEQLGREGASQAGDAATRAAVAASAERANRIRDIEGMRLGSEQDLATRGQANAGNLYQGRAGSAQNLSQLEQQGIQSITNNRMQGASDAARYGYTAADAAGKARMDAADTAGRFDYNAEGGAADLGYRAAAGTSDADYNAAAQGGQAGIDASKYMAGNRQAVDTANQETGQRLASGADAASVARNAEIANARRSGQADYRGYLTDATKTAQSGSQAAAGQRIQNYGTQSNAVNDATGQGMKAAQAKDSQPGMFSKILGAVSGVAGAVPGIGTAIKAGTGIAKSFMADGGIVTQPTLAVIGERGPEKVVKVGSKFGRFGCAA